MKTHFGVVALLTISLLCLVGCGGDTPSGNNADPETNASNDKAGDDKAAMPGEVHSLARYVPEKAFIVACVRPAAIIGTDLLKPIVDSKVYDELTEPLGEGMKPKDIKEILLVAANGKPGARPPVDFGGVMLLNGSMDLEPEIKKYFKSQYVDFDTDVKKTSVEGYAMYVDSGYSGITIAVANDGKSAMYGSSEDFVKAMMTEAVADNGITKAMSAWKDDAVIVAEYVENSDMITFMQQDGAPDELIKHLKSLVSASMAVDLQGSRLITATAKFKDTATPEELEKLAGDTLANGKTMARGMAVEMAEGIKSPEKADEFSTMAEEGIDAVQLTRNEKTLNLVVKRPASLEKAPPMFVNALVAARETAKRNGRLSMIRQFQLAMFNIESATKRFPGAAITDAEGKPLLSWRVAILPLIEEQQLYEKFHKDEPWDSEHNLEVAKEMPSVYKVEGVEDGKTTYVVFTGEDTVFSPEYPKGIKIGQITDGTSKTLSIVQAGNDKAVPWTKPEDIVFDPDDPYGPLGEVTPGGFVAVFVDCHTMVIDPSKVSAETLKAMITRNGAEPYSLDE